MASVKWHLWKSHPKKNNIFQRHPNSTTIRDAFTTLAPLRRRRRREEKYSSKWMCVDIFQHPITTTRERVFSAVLGKRHVPAIRDHSIPFRALASTRAFLNNLSAVCFEKKRISLSTQFIFKGTICYFLSGIPFRGKPCEAVSWKVFVPLLSPLSRYELSLVWP